MIELLFADQSRLQSYAEQLGRRTRRVPSFTGTLGLTGPSISANFSQQDLSKTHEQLNAVRKYIQKQGLVTNERLQACREESPFCEETINLQTVYIPPNGNHPLLKNGLSLWISQDPSGGNRRSVGLLFLIEQFPLPDESSTKRLTGGTLLEILRHEFQWYEIPAELGNVTSGDGYEVVDEPYYRSKMARLRKGFDFPQIPDMGSDTVFALKEFGAKVGSTKRVRALYRVRTVFSEMVRGGSLTMIGYPIAIWLGNDHLKL